MADIAKEAVLTNGTIYHLYNSKQDILLAIYNHYFKPDIGLNLDLEKKLNDPLFQLYIETFKESFIEQFYNHG